MTRIKICGLKEAEHVQAAVEAGANAIGFVFASSKRQVSPEKAQELAAGIPASVKKIGVFVNSSAEEINEIVKTVPLDYVQLHGDESAALYEQIEVPIIRAISIRNAEDVDRAFRDAAPLVLIDAPGTDFRGGSGHTFDWDLVEKHAEARPFILAGGLNPDNVGEAITRIRPVMVDVSSGVETDGRKDSDKIKAFIRAVQEVSL